jgi:aminodeoxyfutalosine deaminase
MTTPADLAALPKAELHVHTEGALRPSTMEEFLARGGLSMTKTFAGLDDFVDAYAALWQTMTRPGDYTRVVSEFCEDAVRQGVRYAELELSPIGRTYDHLAEALEVASRQRDMVLRFSVGNVRTFPVEVAWAMLEAVKDIPEVVVFGLGGKEAGFPAEPFAEVFAEAKRRGLHSVPHAGEAAGPESVRDALDSLAAERINHGVRSIEDPALVAELAERGIPLSVCPTSNVVLRVVRTIDEHPLRQLWDAGVLVSVNTDDPGFFGCDLLGEYAIAGRLLDLDRRGYAQLARNSIDASFAPDELKATLRSEIEDWARKG